LEDNIKKDVEIGSDCRIESSASRNGWVRIGGCCEHDLELPVFSKT
jgi:hypothetical protein